MSEPKAAKLKRLAKLKAKAKARVRNKSPCSRAQRIWDAIKRALPNNEEEDL